MTLKRMVTHRNKCKRLPVILDFKGTVLPGNPEIKVYIQMPFHLVSGFFIYLNHLVMEQSTSIPYSRISLFFVFVLSLLTWGFYKTYIIFFPSFTGFNSVQHFHGAMMLTWMVILIVQPLLIRSSKRSAHRLIGRFTFIIAPLVAVSIFLASKMVYQRPEPQLPHNIKVGMIALSIPAMAAFATLYSLAIINRRNTYNHMRYMIGTSLLMIGRD
jgi:hypothetical protein